MIATGSTSSSALSSESLCPPIWSVLLDWLLIFNAWVVLDLHQSPISLMVSVDAKLTY